MKQKTNIYGSKSNNSDITDIPGVVKKDKNVIRSRSASLIKDMTNVTLGNIGGDNIETIKEGAMDLNIDILTDHIIATEFQTNKIDICELTQGNVNQKQWYTAK